MDAQSIITQASRDEDNGSSTSCLDKVPEAKPVPPTRSTGIFTRLFCCFRPQITRPVIDSSNTTFDDNTDKSKSQTNTVRVNYLLKPVSDKYKDKKCVVIDLDETLVHSSFQPVKNADFIIPVEIDGTIHQVYVLKRPYVEEFLKKMGELFECVLFTASLGKYADPVTDLLDKWNVFQARLFRESCVFHKGNYVKDLSRLGRDLDRVLIVDNSPMSYFFHPKNAVPVVSWFDDSNDRELLDLIPFFEEISKVNDIYTFLENSRLPLGANNPLQMVVTNYSGTFHATGGAPSLNATFSPLPNMPLPSQQENNINGAVNSQDSTARQDRSTMHQQQQQNNIQQQLQQQQFTQHSMLLRTPNTLPRPQQNSLQIQLQRSSLQSNPARQNLVIHHVGSAQASSGGSSSSLQQQTANHH